MLKSAELRICVDCLLYLESEPELEPERVAEICAGLERCGGSVVTGEPEGFSWSPCGLCGSTLGGERYSAAVLVPEPPAYQHARAALRSAMDRQSRAPDAESWLADQAAIERHKATLASYGGDAVAEESAIAKALAVLAEPSLDL